MIVLYKRSTYLFAAAAAIGAALLVDHFIDFSSYILKEYIVVGAAALRAVLLSHACRPL